MLDTSVPHSARIWNYWLGGKDYFEADREAGDAFLAIYPGSRPRRAPAGGSCAGSWSYLAVEVGIRQFLDIGTGLPTADNTHEIAQRRTPTPGSSTSTTTRSCSPTPAPC